jgi:phosphate transport system permease protein
MTRQEAGEKLADELNISLSVRQELEGVQFDLGSDSPFALEQFTALARSLANFGSFTLNGRTILSVALTLTLLILPIIIINAQEAIRAVPWAIREASYGLGATKWQTIWNQVLPASIPGILTGTILAISRAVGETAPLIVVGASTLIFIDPDSPFSKFTALPIQIFNWTSRPQDQFRDIAAAAIIVLLVIMLTLNATAILLRNRYSIRY